MPATDATKQCELLSPIQPTKVQPAKALSETGTRMRCRPAVLCELALESPCPWKCSL